MNLREDQLNSNVSELLSNLLSNSEDQISENLQNEHQNIEMAESFDQILLNTSKEIEESLFEEQSQSISNALQDSISAAVRNIFSDIEEEEQDRILREQERIQENTNLSREIHQILIQTI